MAKMVSWRITGTVITIALVYLFTKNAAVSFSLGGLEIVTKMVVYYIHERAWNGVSWGYNHHR